MKRRMSFFILFFVFLFFQIDVQAATFRTCTYEGDSHSATLTIEQSGSFSLKVDNDSIKGKNTDVSNTLTGKKINEQGCPTWIVNGGKKYYFYYSESRKNSREADLGDDYGYTLTKKSDTIKDVSKSSYDSKCTYNFKYGDKDVDMTYYIYENDFIYATIEDGKSMDNNINGGQTLSDGSYMITSQYFKNYDKDASVECPQIKACAQGTTIELYSGTDYTCSGSEISVTTNGREYGSDYTGPTVDQNEKTTCTTSLKFNDNIGGDLKGQIVEITLSKYANGKRCLEFNGSEKCVEATELPQISQTYKTRDVTILFQDETEADKIYQKAFQSDGTCSGFNIKQVSANSDVVLTLTTQAVDSSESAGTVKPGQTIYDEDFEVLYDRGWTQEDGCLLLQKGDTIGVLQKILNYLRIAAVALLLVLGSMDFAGAIMSSKEDAMKSAGNKFVKRLMACMIVFLVPVLVNLILYVANKSESFCGLFGDTSAPIEASAEVEEEIIDIE